MDRPVTFSISVIVYLILLFHRISQVSANAEGDALNALKTNVADPNNVLQSWDPTLVNPCTWFNVTCNFDNSVVRVDLGNANLSGNLVPQLGQLSNLQYLRIYGNNITGRIPNELGNLTNLVSLELERNNLSGPIPNTMGKLEKLSSLRLNNNSLSGLIPMSLTTIVTLQVLGKIPINGSFSVLTPISFANNMFDPLPVSLPLPVTPITSASSLGRKSAIGAIAAGVFFLASF